MALGPSIEMAPHRPPPPNKRKILQRYSKDLLGGRGFDWWDDAALVGIIDEPTRLMSRAP